MHHYFPLKNSHKMIKNDYCERSTMKEKKNKAMAVVRGGNPGKKKPTKTCLTKKKIQKKTYPSFIRKSPKVTFHSKCA